MKKYLLMILICGIVLTGCSKVKPETKNANNDLMEIENTQRLLSASDVEDTEVYVFSISNDIVSDIDTFKLTDKLIITSENDLEYTLTYSPTEDFNDTSEVSFEDKYETQPQEGYYKIESTDNLDLKISVM